MRARLAACGVVAAGALLAYAATLTYDFVWDDIHLIRNSYNLHQWSTLWKLLGSHFLADSPDESQYYRPFITLTFFLDLKLWGPSPAGFHLSNVLAHAAASLGVLALARRLRLGEVSATMAGLLFALHPIHTESVAFVSGRTDIVAALFVLAGVLAYARWRDSGRPLFLLGSLAAYLMGLASKEVAVALPVLLVGWDGLVRGEMKTWREGARALGRMSPYGVVLGLYLAARVAALGRLADVHGAAPWADLPTRLLTSVRLTAWYAWMTLAPWTAQLSYYLAPDAPPPGWRWWGSAAFLCALFGLTAWALRRAPALGFGALLFWLALVPSVGVNVLAVPRFIMGDRFLYLPSVGFCLLLGAAAGRLAGLTRREARAAAGEAAAGLVGTTGRLRPAPALALVLLVASYAIGAMWRNEDWRDEYRLFLRMTEVSPEALLPRVNLALVQMRRGEVAEAAGNFQRAAAMAPDNGRVLAGLGLTEAILGQVDRGLDHALRARELAPRNPFVLFSLATVRHIRGDLEIAVDEFEEALRASPTQVAAILNMAVAQAKLGRQDDAERTLARALEVNRVLRIDPLFTERARAEVYAGRDPERAIEAWEHYLALLRETEMTAGRRADFAYATSELDRLRSWTR